MSQHESVVLEGKLLSPTEFLKANNMYWPAWWVSVHKLWALARYGLVDSLNGLTLISAVGSYIVAGMIVFWVSLFQSVFVPINAWAFFGQIGLIGTVFFVTFGMKMKCFPFWMRTEVKKKNWFSQGHRGERDLPYEAKRVRDLIGAAYPDAKITVEALGYDPIMWVQIPGTRRRHAVCIWDYDKVGNAIMLHPK
ncbi:hypothetical protein FJY93_01240 [Candidatus Kaiserbacteria bacterium]|nr:hypothetical protein [Candidatus Kaiserbacteria bacterium]